MILTAFDILYVMMLFIMLPFVLLNGRLRRGFLLRMRQLFRSVMADGQRDSERGVVLVHSVSVGEVVASLPLVQALEKEGFGVVVTTATERGYATALKQGLDVRFAPLDFSPLVRTFLREVSPVALILVELELWPNLIFWAHSLRIPVFVVNGRISDESFRRYMWLRGSFVSTLKRVEMVFSQNNLYSERFVMLGMPKERVVMGGNLKFDAAPSKVSPSDRSNVRAEMGASEDDFLIIGGSTYLFEEKVLLDVFRSLGGERRVRLVLAPRQADHFDELVEEVERRRLSHVRRSAGGLGDWDVYIVDTVGELVYLYGGCDVAFVGGTMFAGKGGHSVIEPSAVGLPVIVGEHHENFRDSVVALKAAGGLFVVKNGEELRKRLEELLDGSKRQRMGDAAARCIDLNRGATERILGVLRGLSERE